MAISLLDLNTATETYLEDNVEVRIHRVTGNVETNEQGSFNVRVINATEETGVRLSDVFLHLTVSPSGVLSLIPPGGFIMPRASADVNAPRLSSSDRVQEMFVFMTENGLEPDPTLEPGEEIRLEIGFEGEGAGTATLECHVHATIDVEELFRDSRGTSTERAVTILA